MGSNKIPCDPEALIQAVRRFEGKRVLVLGDLIVDRFVWGSVSRICPEAPVPVVEINKESTRLGGAANVAANIRSLGGMPLPVGVAGNDPEGLRLREMLHTIGSAGGGLVIDKGRPTSVKTRIIAHHQQVCRTDREDRTPVSSAVQRKIAAKFRKAIGRADAVVISDYAKGLISRSLLRQVLPRARAAGKVVCVDPKMIDFAAYSPATVVTPNVSEIEQASGIPICGTRNLARAVNTVLRRPGIGHLLVTRGEEGMALFGNGSRPAYIPTVAREVFDVTGAGDTVISTLALSLVSGLSILEAAVLSNIAAGIVVGKLGTASVSAEELIENIRSI
ncbi:MAG: D-glycero-beta-D-manno-heptose-7-phosphate kinase [Acidobacteria bacterium]|nr:D-glycero-beta-D-manno-heptose-7-phosphate kinase [Acidobacteriota bacterium]